MKNNPLEDTFTDVIGKAQKDQPGTVYSVIPVFRDRRPLFSVTRLTARQRPL